MRVSPDMKEQGLTFGSHMPNGRTLGAIEVPPPDHESESHAGEGGRRRWNAPVLLAFNSAHHGGNELAEENNREETKTLRVVGGIGRVTETVPARKPRGREID